MRFFLNVDNEAGSEANESRKRLAWSMFLRPRDEVFPRYAAPVLCLSILSRSDA